MWLSLMRTKFNIVISIFVLVTMALMTPKIASAAATLRLSPSTGNFATGGTFQVDIVLDTGGSATTGTDVYFNYDSDVISLESIIEGTIYDTYIGKTINNSDGVASISGLITPGGSTYTGTGTLATLQFKALKTGSANVVMDFTQGDPNDSNVAESGNNNDILGGVTNGSYTISTSGGSNPTPTPFGGANVITLTPTPIGTAPNGLPSAGTTLPTVVLIIVSITLLGGGYYLTRTV